ncbi:MAG: hypothetical protein PVJ21_08350 [Anaerolineales bacterium]|jgi:hypothetical protein
MSELNTEKPSLASRRFFRLLFYIIGISIACFSLIVFINSQSRYIEVNIDIPGERDWSYTEKSIQVWNDDPKYFIWRSETTVYKGSPYNFDSKDEIIKYIDNQLTEQDWKNVFPRELGCCYSLLRESEFLENRENYIVVYIQVNDVDYRGRGTPTLCLAVWPPINNYDGFHIVIMTESPSLLTKLAYAFDG